MQQDDCAVDRANDRCVSLSVSSSTSAVKVALSRLQDYASGIVCAVQQVCKERCVPVPTIVTESGRALVSHHAVLVFDVISRYAG